MGQAVPDDELVQFKLRMRRRQRRLDRWRALATRSDHWRDHGTSVSFSRLVSSDKGDRPIPPKRVRQLSWIASLGVQSFHWKDRRPALLPTLRHAEATSSPAVRFSSISRSGFSTSSSEGRVLAKQGPPLAANLIAQF